MTKQVESGTKRDWWRRYMDMFEKESDRACVILTVSFMDELLTLCLRSRLVADHSATDSLFDGANAPFSTFSSKIDLSFRLGILSNRLAKDLHLIRRIRNDFAHNIEGCDFADTRVHNRVCELRRSFATLLDSYKEPKKTLYPNGDRGDFQFCASWIVDYLHEYSGSVNAIGSAADEWGYDSKQIGERIARRAT